MFTFAWPLAFFLLPLLWVANKFLPKASAQEAMLRVPFLERIKALKSMGEFSRHSSRNMNHYLALLAWTLLVCAAANPQWLGELLPIKQTGRNIMLAVDLSPSMSMPDLRRSNNTTVNRLQTVKGVADEFIDKRIGDKLGLILFGSKAYLQTPLTFDRTTVRTMLDDASIGLAGDRTAIGDAIGLAIKKMSVEDIKSRILILLTDGGNNSGTIDPREAAKIAQENHIKIYTVGIGASQMVLRGFFGDQVVNPSADLDEDLLKNIADTTRGQYFRARDEKSLAHILEAINQLEPITTDNKTARPITALFYWPLAAVLIIFVLLLYPRLDRDTL